MRELLSWESVCIKASIQGDYVVTVSATDTIKADRKWENMLQGSGLYTELDNENFLQLQCDWNLG